MSDMTKIASELRDWSRDWYLDGDLAGCKKCGAKQCCSYADIEFRHRDGCANIDVFPWYSLAYMTDTIVKILNLPKQGSKL